ncbi:MAG: DMT family transporter [Marinobacterium sp.]|nr:DMT family transporter [Marinobacterium sp.]
MTRSHLDGRAILILTFLCVLFGWQQIAIKFTLDGISPIMQAGLRSLIAGALLCCWMCYRGEKILRRDGIALWGIMAGILFALEFLFLYRALEHTDAARATVFLYTSPFVVALGAQLFIPGEQLRKLQIAGLCCAFAGIVLAFSDALTGNGAGQNDEQLLGDLMALTGAIAWGATTVLIKATPMRFESASRVLLYQLLVSGIVLPPAALLLGEPGIIQLDSQTVLAFSFQCVVVAFFAYLSWFWLMRQYPASQIATFSFLTPLFGVISAAVLLDESISTGLALALVLVAGGIYLVSRPADPERKQTESGSEKARNAVN